jgi:hypothetical protein
MKLIFGFIFIVVVLWFLWVLSGGPAKFDPNSGKYIAPPAPLGTGETYGPTLQTTE